MIQHPDRPRFLFHAPLPCGFARKILGENLHRHISSQTRIPRPVDLTHAAGPEQADYLVRPEARARLEAGPVSFAYDQQWLRYPAVLIELALVVGAFLLWRGSARFRFRRSKVAAPEESA